MNELILPIILPFLLALWLALLPCGYILILNLKNNLSKRKTKNLPPVYTEEEIELAQFLEKRQAVNEAFLSAQAELLKELRK